MKTRVALIVLLGMPLFACGQRASRPPPPAPPVAPAPPPTPPTPSAPPPMPDVSQNATAESLHQALVAAQNDSRRLFGLADPTVGFHFYSYSSSDTAFTFCDARALDRLDSPLYALDLHDRFECDAGLSRCIAHSGERERAFVFSNREIGGKYLLEIVDEPSSAMDGDTDAADFIVRASLQCRFLGALQHKDPSVSSQELWVWDGEAPGNGVTSHHCGAQAAANVESALRLAGDLQEYWCHGLRCNNDAYGGNIILGEESHGALTLRAVLINVPGPDDLSDRYERAIAQVQRHNCREGRGR